MKVKITKMPVRIDNERHNIGSVIDVTEKTYETIKSICMIVEESENKKKVNKVKKEPEQVNDNTTEYDKLTKDDIMIKLSELGIGADPSLKKKELYDMLVSAKNE